MMSIEIVIFIANICLSISSSKADVAESLKCNEFMLECVPNKYRKQFIKNETRAFNDCYIEFEISK